MMKFALCRFLALGLLLGIGAPSKAGWRCPQGLGAMLSRDKAIAVFEVKSVNAEKRVIIFKKVEDIQSKLPQRFWLYVTRKMRNSTGLRRGRKRRSGCSSGRNLAAASSPSTTEKSTWPATGYRCGGPERARRPTTS